MGPLAAALIPAGATLMGNLIGQERGAALSRQESARNRQFQERMRNTEWQAGIEDMKAAGLNPALAYSQGPAASPGGSMASQSIDYGASSAAGSARIGQELRLLQQQVKKSAAETKSAEWKALMDEARVKAYGVSRTKSGSLRLSVGDDVENMLPYMTREVLANLKYAESRAAIAGVGGSFAGLAEPFMGPARQVAGTSARGFQSLADVITLLERGANMKDRAFQAFFGIPKRAAEKMIAAYRRRKK